MSAGGPLRGPPWQGGKSAAHAGGGGAWIAAQLPPVDDFRLYAEPFGGMLGVLLQRPPAGIEAVNDLDGALYCFWQAVRDHHGELLRLLEATPARCPRTLAEARRVLDDPGESPVRRGWALATAAVMARGRPRRGPIGHRSMMSGGGGGSPRVVAGQVEGLAERLRSVELHSLDALDFIERVDHPRAVLYVDPPYDSTDCDTYVAGVDHGALSGLLLGCESRVALSSYGGPHVERLEAAGWRTARRVVQASGPLGRMVRVEHLTMNFEPPVCQPSLF